MEKLYVVKKYVMANSAKAAILKERKTSVDSVWIDEEWYKNNLAMPTKEVSFHEKKPKKS